MITKLVNIGETELEVYVQGERGPMVVIETGMGSSLYTWNTVISEISKAARVLIYHREGYGRSLLTQEPCTSKRIAENLYCLLEKQKIQEPIILVGHSFGGLCALHFAKLYPAMISALVLVDSSPVEMYKVEALKRTLTAIQNKYPTTKALERMKRFAEMNKKELLAELSPKPSLTQEQIIEFIISPSLYRAQASELENMIDSGRAIEALGNLPNIPIKVIGRDEEVEINNLINAGIPQNEAVVFEGLMQELNRGKVNYTTKGELILAKGSGHNVHIEHPDIVIQAIEAIYNMN